MYLKTYFGLFLSILTFINLCIYPQEYLNNISGKIIDEANNKPVFGVNVFLTGTTWGTVSNKEGYYQMSSIKPGKYELVISIIGYEVITKNINLFENTILKIDFKLIQKLYELNPVEIISEKPKEWQNNLEIFKNLFLGQNKIATDCIIENEFKLDFERNGNNILSARINEPLVLINRSLGFKIYCILINFSWDSEESRIKFAVKPRFEELIPISTDERSIWVKNRNEVYDGSLTRFLRSLIDNDFMEKRYKIFLNYLPVETKNTSRMEQVFKSNKILWQGMRPGEFVLQFENYLRVVYNDQISWLKLKYPDVTLDKYGNPEETLPFETYGYWSNSGMADMLPINFEIDEK